VSGPIVTPAQWKVGARALFRAVLIAADENVL
jgi:hypothetical protein